MDMRNHNNFTGLNAQQVAESKLKDGGNKVAQVSDRKLMKILKEALHEPMLVLLAIASLLYFLHGDMAEGIFLLVSIIAVYSISNFQESRSTHALSALKKLTQPKCTVIRDSEVQEISWEDLVTNDLIIAEEGSVVPADATILQCNDFTVNESILTGESLPVEKDETSDKNLVYQGTLVVSGLAICRVTAVGSKTQIAKVGKSIEEIKQEKSPLQIQINSFVRKMVALGVHYFPVDLGHQHLSKSLNN